MHTPLSDESLLSFGNSTPALSFCCFLISANESLFCTANE